MTKTYKNDEERLQALEEAYLAQTAESYVKNKLRGVASMKVIYEKAGVDKTYVYGHKDSSPENLKKYEDFVDKVNKFAKAYKTRNEKIVSNEINLEEQLHNARENNFVLQFENNELKLLLVDANQKLKTHKAELSLQSVINKKDDRTSAASQLNENTISTICPDDGLIHNNKYEFSNVKLRNKAWREAKQKFQKLMRRNIPQRVYILVGLPSSGKSTWANETRDFNKDRHTVIIDATNLTVGERSQWIMLARKGQNIKICAVKFFTEFITIKERNIENIRNNKFIEVSVLETKRDSLEEIDFEFEDIDEMIVVRND